MNLYENVEALMCMVHVYPPDGSVYISVFLNSTFFKILFV